MKFSEELRKFFRELFSLHGDSASNAEIKDRIINGGQFRGTNMCILILAIIIASIGLNMNSTAVIIGAMLISPLMGGIMSMAYGLATADLRHFRSALVSFIMQVVISMITSTVYFKITPLQMASNEMIARITPTIWDVLIALCGGIAGIIATTRKDRVNNVVPGVAIATALMPPLCTAGYGLATMQWRYFFGAAYLFFINMFFICLTSVIMLRILHVPLKSHDTVKKARNSKIWVTLIVLVTILPSVYLAYQTVERSIAENQYEQYMAREFKFESTQVVSSKFDPVNRVINVALIGTNISQEQIDDLQKQLPAYKLSDVTLRVSQMEVKQGVTEEELQSVLAGRDADAQEMDTELASMKEQLTQARELLDSRTEADAALRQIQNEILALYPKVKSVSVTSMQAADGSEERLAAVISVTELFGEDELSQIQSWLNMVLEKDYDIRLIQTYEPGYEPPETEPETESETELESGAQTNGGDGAEAGNGDEGSKETGTEGSRKTATGDEGRGTGAGDKDGV